MNEFERQINEEFEKQKAELMKPNIVVVGGTGVGKSSLVNRFFGKEVAKVGNGKPVTQGMMKYTPDNSPVIIYDTEGYEISSAGLANKTNFDQNIKPEIEKMNSGSLKEQIHLVWYCISIATHRVTDYDLQNIEYFISGKMKIAVVFTQCDLDEELPDGGGKDALAFKNIILEKFPNMQFFETSSDLELDLEKLGQWSMESLADERLKESFIAAQKVSISAKKDRAYNIVKIAAGSTAATAGVNPFPLSDSILLVPQQIAMCMQISTIFGFGSLGEATGSLLKAQIVSLAGKQIVASLTKFIPVLGQGINAAVAGAITYGLGVALIEIYANAHEEYYNTGKMPNWTEVFSSDIFLKTISSYYEKYKPNKS